MSNFEQELEAVLGGAESHKEFWHLRFKKYIVTKLRDIKSFFCETLEAINGLKIWRSLKSSTVFCNPSINTLFNEMVLFSYVLTLLSIV